MAVIVNGDGILTGISSLATSLTDITSGRGTVTGVATVGTLQLGAGVSISSPRSQNAAIFTNNTEFFTVDDAGRVGVGTITPNSDAHPENEKKINVGFITAKSIAGDIDARNVVVAGISTFTAAAPQISVVGNEGVSAALRLTADQGDDNGDGWEIRSNQDANDLTISNNTSGSYVDKFTLQKTGELTLTNDLAIPDKIIHAGDSNTALRFPASDVITAETAGSERLRIDSNGIICVRHTNALHSGNLQVATSGSDAIDINAYSSTAANGGRLTFYRSKNATIGSNTIVADNDSLGRIDFRGYNTNGNAYNVGATIEVEVDGAVDSSTDMPSAIKFSTSANGSSTPTERLNIDSTGAVNIGSSPAQATGTHTANAILTAKGYPGDETSAAILALVRGNNTTSTAAGHTLGRIVFSDKQAGEYAMIEGEAESTGAVGDTPGRLIFATASDGATTPSEKMRITESGKVGINVTSPDDTLDVAGTCQVTSNTYIGGDIYMYGNSYSDKGIFLGGSGSANKFDDYEFGTFTPTCAVETQSNFSLSVAKGLYVKVGKTVHVWFEIQANGTPGGRTTGRAWEFGGFPFLSQNDTDSSHPGLRDYRYPLIAMNVDTGATYGTTGSFILRLNDNAQGGRIEWQENISNIRNASLYIQDSTMVQFGCTYPTSM